MEGVYEDHEMHLGQEVTHLSLSLDLGSLLRRGQDSIFFEAREEIFAYLCGCGGLLDLGSLDSRSGLGDGGLGLDFLNRAGGGLGCRHYA